MVKLNTNTGSYFAAMQHEDMAASERRLRREMANSNERRRMQNINAGFDALKMLLPKGNSDKLSKASILQNAVEYINELLESRDKLAAENSKLRQGHKVTSSMSTSACGATSVLSHRDSDAPSKRRKEEISYADSSSSSSSTSSDYSSSASSSPANSLYQEEFRSSSSTSPTFVSHLLYAPMAPLGSMSHMGTVSTPSGPFSFAFPTSASGPTSPIAHFLLPHSSATVQPIPRSVKSSSKASNRSISPIIPTHQLVATVPDIMSPPPLSQPQYTPDSNHYARQNLEAIFEAIETVERNSASPESVKEDEVTGCTSGSPTEPLLKTMGSIPAQTSRQMASTSRRLEMSS